MVSVVTFAIVMRAISRTLPLIALCISTLTTTILSSPSLLAVQLLEESAQQHYPVVGRIRPRVASLQHEQLGREDQVLAVRVVEIEAEKHQLSDVGSRNFHTASPLARRL